MKCIPVWLVICTGLFISCSKSKEEGAPTNAAFELMEKLPGEPRLYEQADLVIHNNQPFISATRSEFGNRNSVFLFPLQDGWRKYEQPNQEFVLLTSFNNMLYGIMEFREPYQAGQVSTFRYSYFLYKWINSAFENIARLDFTDHNGVARSPLQNLRWYKNQDRLQLVAQQSNGTSFLWNLTLERFDQKQEIGNSGLNQIVIPSTAGINFTSYRQINGAFDRLDIVQNYFFNGQSLQAGKEHLFQETLDGSFDNTYLFYAGMGNALYGIRANQLRNLDTDLTIKELADGLSFQVSSIKSANGKLYMLIGKGDADCKKLGVFDGANFKEYTYSLPAELDPCSRLLDVEEVNGKLYCLLLSNRQLAVVQRSL